MGMYPTTFKFGSVTSGVLQCKLITYTNTKGCVVSVNKDRYQSQIMNEMGDPVVQNHEPKRWALDEMCS